MPRVLVRQATKLFRQALEVDPKFEAAMVQLANAYAQIGSYAAAEELYSKALDLVRSPEVRLYLRSRAGVSEVTRLPSRRLQEIAEVCSLREANRAYRTLLEQHKDVYEAPIQKMRSAMLAASRTAPM